MTTASLSAHTVPTPPWSEEPFNLTAGADEVAPCGWLLPLLLANASRLLVTERGGSGVVCRGGVGGVGVGGASGVGPLVANFWIGHGLSSCPLQLPSAALAVASTALALVGIVFNGLIAAAWSRPGLRSAPTYYLAALSAFASVHLTLNAAYWIASLAGGADAFLGATACKAYLVLTRGTAYTVTGLTFVVLLQRLLATRQPPAPQPLSGSDAPTSPTSALAPSTVAPQPSAPEEDPDDPVQHAAILIAAVTFTLGMMGGMHVIFWSEVGGGGKDKQCAIRRDLSWQYALFGLTTDALFGLVLPIAILGTSCALGRRIGRASRCDSAETQPSLRELSCARMIRTVSCFRALCLIVSTAVGLGEHLFAPFVGAGGGGDGGGATVVALVPPLAGDRHGYAVFCLINQLVSLLVKSHYALDAALCALASTTFRRLARAALCGSDASAASASKLPAGGSARASRSSRLSALTSAATLAAATAAAAAASAAPEHVRASQSKCSIATCITHSAAAAAQPASAVSGRPMLNGSAGGASVKYDVVVSARGLSDGCGAEPSARPAPV